MYGYVIKETVNKINYQKTSQYIIIKKLFHPQFELNFILIFPINRAT